MSVLMVQAHWDMFQNSFFIVLYGCYHTCLFSSVDLWVFPPFGFVANASMNTSLQMSTRVSAFNYFGYVSRGGISGSYGNAVFIFV